MTNITKTTPRMVVTVRFMQADRNGAGNGYDYFDETGVMPGGYALVAAGADETIKIVQVVDRFELSGVSGVKAGRSVIADVTEPLKAYFASIDLRLERARALKRLDQIDKRYKSVERYERLAVVDPEAAELLKMLKDTQGKVLDEQLDMGEVEEMAVRNKRRGGSKILADDELMTPREVMNRALRGENERDLQREQMRGIMDMPRVRY